MMRKEREMPSVRDEREMNEHISIYGNNYCDVLHSFQSFKLILSAIIFF